MAIASKTGKPVKYDGMEERTKAFKKSIGLRKEWEECSRLGLNYEQMAARGVKTLRIN